MNSKIKRTYIPAKYDDFWYKRWYDYDGLFAKMYWSMKDQEIKFI